MFHNITRSINRKPANIYTCNGEGRIQDILEHHEYQEEALNIYAMNRVNLLLDYFRQNV